MASLAGVADTVFTCRSPRDIVSMRLHCSQNRLSYIPETIGTLSNLRKLRLRGNQLRDLPDGICRLRALQELDLSQNPLVSSNLRIASRSTLSDSCLTLR